MKLMVFGNPDEDLDNRAVVVAGKLKDVLAAEVVFIASNEDLLLDDKGRAVILDVVAGINEVTVMTEKDLDKLVIPERSTTHDYDLGLQLKYLQKIGKLKKVTIIGIPQTEKIDYDLIHSTLRKLVAQDIQGS